MRFTRAGYPVLTRGELDEIRLFVDREKRAAKGIVNNRLPNRGGGGYHMGDKSNGHEFPGAWMPQILGVGRDRFAA